MKKENNSSIMEVPVRGFIMDSLLTSSILGNQGNEFDMIGMDNNNNKNINQQGIGISDFEREMNLAMQLSLEENKKQEKNKKKNKKMIMRKKNDNNITPSLGNNKIDDEKMN